jgi:hypothetical protein
MTMTVSRLWKGTLLVVLAFCGMLTRTARAEGDETELLIQYVRPATWATAEGALLQLVESPSLEGRQGLVAGFTGYDSSRGAATFKSIAELRFWGPVAVRVGAVYEGAAQSARPSVGARVQALREGRSGIDGTVSFTYRPEGFTESEGELESVVSLGRHLGPVYALGNLAYGQDPEGKERDGEVGVACLRTIRDWLTVGVNGRARVNLGSTGRRAGSGEPTFDALIGPVVTAASDHVAVSLEGGASAFRSTEAIARRYGAFVLAGVGIVF